MKRTNTGLDGVIIINNEKKTDNRGSFVKVYNKTDFKQMGLDFICNESYYSVSDKDVIRGMHFQKPPHDHYKLVYVACGSILDVVLDIRVGSKTYGKFIKIDLSADNSRSVYIGKGFAHGFKSMEQNTIVVYQVSSEYEAKSDCGVLWNSFGCDWAIKKPIISKRDDLFPAFSDYISDFDLVKR